MTINASRLGPGLLTFGGTGDENEFGAQTTATALEPDVDEGDDEQVLSGETLSGEDEYTYMLTGTAFQDYTGMTSWIVWCKENQGIEMPFTFTPNSAAGLTVKGTVKIRPVKFGGEVKERNKSDFEFKGVGDYTFSAGV